MEINSFFSLSYQPPPLVGLFLFLFCAFFCCLLCISPLLPFWCPSFLCYSLLAVSLHLFTSLPFICPPYTCSHLSSKSLARKGHLMRGQIWPLPTNDSHANNLRIWYLLFFFFLLWILNGVSARLIWNIWVIHLSDICVCPLLIFTRFLLLVTFKNKCNHWIISTRDENAVWSKIASSVIKHERNVTKIAHIPAVGLFHTGRLLAVFLLILVLSTVGSRAFGGHVADIFHLFVCLWPHGTGKLFKTKWCLISAEVRPSAERKPMMVCW